VQFEHQFGLVQHIDAVHLLKCSFHDCEGAGFKTNEALKRHVGRFHTSFLPAGERGGVGGGNGALGGSGSESESEDVGASPSADSVAEDEDLLL